MLERVLKKSLGIKAVDRVLVVTDIKKLPIAKEFCSAALSLSPKVAVIKKPVGRRNGEEPPAAVAAAMRRSDVVMAITTFSITHTDATRAAVKNKTRIASMPGFTKDMMRALYVSPELLLNRGNSIFERMKSADIVKVTTKTGTDIRFSIKNRLVDVDSGLISSKKYTLGNLPAGEVSASPIEGTADGIIFIDSMENYAKPNTTVNIAGGKAVGISDRNCKLAKIFDTVKNSRNVAEFGIGTNPRARIIGNILLDEKVAGTCHIAFGNNVNYGGKINSKFHGDAILMKPDIYFDKRHIMKSGKLLL